MTFPDEGLAGQNRGSGAVGCGTGDRRPASVQRRSRRREDGGLRRSPALQQGEVLKHLPGAHHLLQTVLVLELGIPGPAKQRPFNYSTLEAHSCLAGLLRVVGGMFVVFPGDFGKVLRFSA